MAANQEALHAPLVCFHHPRARHGQRLLLRPRLQLRLPVGRSLPVRRQLRLTRPSRHRAPCPRETAGRGLVVAETLRAYFFLPWFFTASMAALAASGSR